MRAVPAGHDYGALDDLAAQRINFGLIAEHWEDLLSLAGPLKLGTVPGAGASPGIFR